MQSGKYIPAVLTLTVVAVMCTSLVNAQSIELWKSEPENNLFLTRMPNLVFTNETSCGNYFNIEVDESKKYQIMDGFGASMTDASSWVMKNHLTDAKRAEIMQKLFGSDGINLSLLRQPIGSTDFARESWSLDDMSGNLDDFNLKNFSLAREEAYIRPMLNQALNVNKTRVKLFASPWSPPAWMKTNRSLFGKDGGILRKECYATYAQYFVQYIQENDRLGSPLYAITVQNEPLYAPQYYPGMLMSEAEQADFILNHLAPSFARNNITTKIVGYDHNYDQPGVIYASALLNDPNVNNLIGGIGFHIYTYPNHQAMTYLNGVYPGNNFWITEAGSGLWIGNNTQQFLDQMMHLIRGPANWAKGVIFWNLALDQNSSPKLANVDPPNTNRGFLTIRSDTMDNVSYEMSYYSMGHSSKFVDPGAYRIDTSMFMDKLESVAYINPDNNTIVVVIRNPVNEAKKVRINWKGLGSMFEMAGLSAATLKWKIF